MRENLKAWGVALALTLIPTLLVWAPFFLRIKEVWHVPLPTDGMATVIANFDGPLYIVVAKTFYNNLAISELFSFPLPVEYYAAHFPLFPLLISVVGQITGFPWGMIIVTVATATISLYFFQKLIAEYVPARDVFWMTAVFSVFPARWLIVRSTGSPEPLFVGAILASMYFFRQKKYWRAGLWGAVAQFTKSPASLLFLAYAGYLLYPKVKELAITNAGKWVNSLPWRAYPLNLIPLSLLGVFIVYNFTFNNFFAYFNSGDNIHLLFPPFRIFDYAQPWVGTFWLEEIIFVYLFGLMGLLRLIRKGHHELAWFVGIFFGSILFVTHRDIMRYSLPIFPFLYVAFSDVIAHKDFKIAMAVLIIPIYLFSLAFIANNVQPISDWTPLL